MKNNDTGATTKRMLNALSVGTYSATRKPQTPRLNETYMLVLERNRFSLK